MRAGLGLLAVLVFPLGLFVRGEEHPIPLQENFDFTECASCHSNKQEGKYVHTAVSLGCGACHQVEKEEGTTFVTLTAPREELCGICHEKSEEQNAHAPYAQDQCALCHDPHATGFPAQTRAETNALCMACHLSRLEVNERVSLFGSQTVTLAEFKKIRKISLGSDSRAGHPFLVHPVADHPDPLREGKSLSCLSCHQSHTAPLPRLLRGEWKEIEVCDRCHNAARAARKQP